MTDLQMEWFYIILPFVTIPSILLWIAFFKFVIPQWFGLLEG